MKDALGLLRTVRAALQHSQPAQSGSGSPSRCACVPGCSLGGMARPEPHLHTGLPMFVPPADTDGPLTGMPWGGRPLGGPPITPCTRWEASVKTCTRRARAAWGWFQRERQPSAVLAEHLLSNAQQRRGPAVRSTADATTFGPGNSRRPHYPCHEVVQRHPKQAQASAGLPVAGARPAWAPGRPAASAFAAGQPGTAARGALPAAAC